MNGVGFSGCLKVFIVDKLQNYNALARLAVLFYTVAGKAAFSTFEVYRLYQATIIIF